MQKINLTFILLISIFLFACENDIDLNTEFVETTVVFGLLDKNSDTQFVKINKTFIDDQLSAIDLAKQSDRLFFDTLEVNLIEGDNIDTFPLSKIQKPKDPGLFANDRNDIYYTTARLKSNTTYRLSIKKADSTFTFGQTETIDTVLVDRPRLSLGNNSSVAFINRDFRFAPAIFSFVPGKNVAEMEVTGYFHFIEIIGNDSIARRVRFPINNFTSPPYETRYDGERFFNELESQVAPSTNPTRKVIPNFNNIEIEIISADADLKFFRELNGPIEGLAQVRPEFTNIENGIGLFSSRLKMSAFTRLDQNTRIHIFQTYRDNRNFVAQ